MMMPNFPTEEWLGNLLLDEDRETYAAMTPGQRRLVRFAYNYGWIKHEVLIKEIYNAKTTEDIYKPKD